MVFINKIMSNNRCHRENSVIQRHAVSHSVLLLYHVISICFAHLTTGRSPFGSPCRSLAETFIHHYCRRDILLKEEHFLMTHRSSSSWAALSKLPCWHHSDCGWSKRMGPLPTAHSKISLPST